MAMLPDVTSFLTARPNSGECQDGHLAKFLSGGASPTECRFQSAFPEQFYQKCSSFGGTPIHASVKLRLGSNFNLQKTLGKIPDIAPYAGLIAMILGIGPGDIIDIRDAAAYCLPSACSDQGTQAIEKYVIDVAQTFLEELGLFDSEEASLVADIVSTLPGMATFRACDGTPYGAYEINIPDVAVAIADQNLRAAITDITSSSVGKGGCGKPRLTARPTTKTVVTDRPSKGPTNAPTKRAPTPFPTSKPTKEIVPTPFPTKKPTKAPTLFSCSNIRSKVACTMKKNQEACMWTGKCEDRAPDCRTYKKAH